MSDEMLTFFEEAEILLGMVNEAFPEGAKSFDRRNMITLGQHNAFTIVVWAETKDGIGSFHIELDADDDKKKSFEDVIFELKSYIKGV